MFEALDAVGDAARKYVSGRDRAKGRIAGAPDGLDLARNQADVIVWIGHACDAIRSRLAALTLYNEGSTIR